jgi:pyruvate, orthophosphate dikinase
MNNDDLAGVSPDYSVINQVLLRYYQHTYLYWLSEDDPQVWFEKEAENTNVIPTF